jgi:membrane-bound lytic murein transglycosylase D
MNSKKPLAVVISTVLSLAGVTGCSTTSQTIKQADSTVSNNNTVANKSSNDQQVFNEIYTDAVKLGFNKRTMSKYYKKRNVAQQKKRLANHRRYQALAKRKAASSRRYTLRPNKQVVSYNRQRPRYQQPVANNVRRWVRPAVNRRQVQNQPRQQFRGSGAQYANATSGDMWHRVRSGFRMGSELHNPTVRKALRQYTSNPARLNRIFARSTEYMHFIMHELNRRGMPTELALLPMVESAFKNKAVSRSGAAGMWQFMPATGKDFGLHRSRGFDARMDIFASTRAALTYLQKINKELNGDWYLTLAAYNVGQNRIHRERAKNRKKGRRTDYWSLSLPKETREYVPRLLAYKEIMLNPKKYGVRLPAMSNNAIIAQTNVNKSINLRQVAQMAGLPAATLIRLNPNFKNGVTNPRLSRKVVLPRQHANRLNHAIKNAPSARRASYKPKGKSRRYSRKSGGIIRHHVRRGDTLNNIAARYGTTISQIMRMNSMRSTQLRTGRNLKIAARSRSWSRG